MYDDEHNNGGWHFEEIKSRYETDGERKGLYTFDGGNCDFYANGFDCRDCSLADRCPNYRNFD